MRKNTDTFGSQDPERIARSRADVAEYESYLPQFEGNGRTGSTRVKHPKPVQSQVHPARTREGTP